MVRKLKVEGFSEFEKVIAELEKEKLESLFVLFSGSKDTTGKSWCPDCVAGVYLTSHLWRLYYFGFYSSIAEPIIEQALEEAPENAVFLYVGVGERNL